MCVLIYLPCSQHLSSILSASILSSVPPRNIILSSVPARNSFLSSPLLSRKSPTISPSRNNSYDLPFSQQLLPSPLLATTPIISPTLHQEDIHKTATIISRSRSSLLPSPLLASLTSAPFLAKVSYHLPFSQQSPIISPTLHQEDMHKTATIISRSRSSLLPSPLLASLTSAPFLAKVSYHLPFSQQSPIISPTLHQEDMHKTVTFIFPSRSSLLSSPFSQVLHQLPFSQQSPIITLLATVSYHLPFSQPSPIISPSRNRLLSSPLPATVSVLLQRTLWSALCCSKTNRCGLHPHLCFFYFRVWSFPVRRNLGIRLIIIFLVLFCDEKSSH